LTEHNGKSNNVLLHCTGVEGAISCDPDNKTIGYIINADDAFKYIVCNAKANGENECDAYDIIPNIPDEGNSCSIGKLYNNKGNYKLCIDVENSVSIIDASFLIDAMTKSVFINQVNVPNVGQYYIIVNIKSGNIILNSQGKL